MDWKNYLNYTFLALLMGGLVFGLFGAVKKSMEIQTEDIDFVITGMEQGNYLPVKDPQGRNLGGMATLKGYLEKSKKENLESGRGFFSFNLGDSLFGNPYTNYTRGQFMVELLNDLHLDGFLLGNLEFSYHPTIQKTRFNEAKFPLISSNIWTTSGNFHPQFKPYLSLKWKNYKLGVLGFSPLDGNTIILRDNIAHIDFKSVRIAMEKLSELIKNENFDYLIALSQINETELNQEVLEVLKNHQVGSLVKIVYGLEKMGLEEKENINVVNFQGLNRGTKVLKIRVRFNPQNKKPHQVDLETVPLVNREEWFDRETGNKIALYHQKIKNTLEIPVGNASVKIPKFSDPSINPSFQESPLGNLVTDVIRKSVNVDVVFLNSGSIREELPKGPLSNADIFRCFPFNDDVYYTAAEGYILEALLEASASSRYGLLQVSGLSYQIDWTKREGERISKVFINGDPVNREKKYTLAVTAFLKGGGDGFVEFTRLPGYRKGPSRVQQLLREYIRKYSPVSAKLENRILCHGQLP